jgi:hypothetical protein
MAAVRKRDRHPLTRSLLTRIWLVESFEWPSSKEVSGREAAGGACRVDLSPETSSLSEGGASVRATPLK